MLARRVEGKLTMLGSPSHCITACLQLVKIAVNDQTLDNLLSAVEREIVSSSRRIENVSHIVDKCFLEAMTDDECNSTEQLLGLVSVAAQTFITTVRSRLAMLSDRCKKDVGRHLSFITSQKAYEILKSANLMQNGSKYTEIEVINAIANYWKHQEEWSTRIEKKDEDAERVWNQEKLTVEIVMSIGMSPSSTGNLRTAFETLGVTSPYEDLSPIRKKLHNWAHSLYKKAQSEVDAFVST